MRVFVTGATGFIGSAIVNELVESGHRVHGLARSDASAEALAKLGVGVQRGDLEDLDSLRAGAASSDGVIHTAFIHDFSKFKENCEIEGRAIEAIGSELLGTDKPFIITSGTALISPGRLATESDDSPFTSEEFPRIASEQSAFSFAERGVKASVLRLPPSVHGRGDHGFVPMLIETARQKGFAACVGEGANVWPAVHRLDAAHLYRLALETAKPGTRIHGAAEGGIPMRAIQEAIGEGLGIPVRSLTPEEAQEHFGWMVRFVGIDNPTSGEVTRETFGWNPTQPGLLADMRDGGYFA